MTRIVFKRILTGFLVIIILAILLMLTPRVWSVLHPDKPPVGYHFMPPTFLALWVGLERLADLVPQIPEDILEIKNIEYKNLNGKSLQLDIYKPADSKGKPPLLVFIHGGGWKSGERSDYLVYLVAFAKRGYMTATVSYRLVRDASYPACIEDICDAVNWFFENGDTYGYDPDRIALIGGSAGAHLALLAAYGWANPATPVDSAELNSGSRRIKAVVDIYGPVDLTTEYAKIQPMVEGLMAFSYNERPDLYYEASPINYVDGNDPPTLIFHGTSDELVPVSQSDMLKAKLDSLGVPSVYYRLPLWPHTMDVAKRVNIFCQAKMTEFFEYYLKQF
jgi:acetyl esterase/lipase